MEATEQNPIVYEMTLDLACGPIADLASWVREFPVQRYGLADAAAASAWDRLRTTVYDAPGRSRGPERHARMRHDSTDGGAGARRA